MKKYKWDMLCTARWFIKKVVVIFFMFLAFHVITDIVTMLYISWYKIVRMAVFQGVWLDIFLSMDTCGFDYN